eukprot:CAMPEP_0182595094 /NCGR_PEP_ID=MMETSP1324-20130603/81599_1 /TAXON_ID=236786 /ORGANISM="Florenciella sp., Strain RCC1587" /LENGTH=51 /DNA_ID=CAMNT_0024812681 /DNA_START=87 /DNA_END=242 /DNA_ORIENTATION=+
MDAQRASGLLPAAVQAAVGPGRRLVRRRAVSAVSAVLLVLLGTTVGLVRAH